jgi:hypothetical protein
MSSWHWTKLHARQPVLLNCRLWYKAVVYVGVYAQTKAICTVVDVAACPSHSNAFVAVALHALQVSYSSVLTLPGIREE